jgi:hypothetical protein
MGWNYRVANHEAKIVTKFFEDEVIYRFKVPKYVLTNNGGEWAIEFDQLCKNME